MSDRPFQFQIGDISVAQVTAGFMLSRATRPASVGDVWWACVRVVANWDEALGQGHALAAANGSRLFLETPNGEFELLDGQQNTDPDGPKAA